MDVYGRKGRGQSRRLIDTLISRAEAEVAKRNPEFSATEHRRIAETIAVAAVRFSGQVVRALKIIAFDTRRGAGVRG